MRKAIYLLALGIISIGWFAAGAWAQAQPMSGFERLKALVGTWEAHEPQGKPLTNTIRLVSNGTALVV